MGKHYYWTEFEFYELSSDFYNESKVFNGEKSCYRNMLSVARDSLHYFEKPRLVICEDKKIIKIVFDDVKLERVYTIHCIEDEKKITMVSRGDFSNDKPCNEILLECQNKLFDIFNNLTRREQNRFIRNNEGNVLSVNDRAVFMGTLEELSNALDKIIC